MNTTSRAIVGEGDVRGARDFVRSFLVGEDDEVIDVVVLLTSEIATNAIKHARGRMLICVGRMRNRVRVSVSDEDSGRPVSRRATTDQESGRGMAIVEALATSWGVERIVNGKRVWFDVDLVSAPRNTGRAALPGSA